MSEVQNNSGVRMLPKSLQFVTHFYTKGDVMRIWGITNYLQFEELIGEQGKEILGWREGKQRFSPNTVRKLVEYIGTPLTISVH